MGALGGDREQAPAMVGESSEYEPASGFVDELFAERGTPREHAAGLVSTLDGMGRVTLVDLGRRRDEIFRQQGITFAIADPDGASNQERPFPLDLVPRIIPAAEWESDRARPRSAPAGAQRVHRRRLPRARDRPRADRPLGAGARLAPVPARGPRRPPAGRHLLPRLRMRPGPRRRRLLAGARGQLPHSVGHLLRAREPPRDDAARAGALHRLPRPAGRPLPAASAERPAGDRPGGRARPHGGRLDARPGEQRLLRALLHRQADGRRAGRGRGPRRPRRHLLHAHHRGPRPRRRDLPPPRRRLHRPARVPPRLAARRPGPDPRLPRGHGGARERGRHRGRGRQGRLRLRPGDDPLLPQRGAAARQRAHLPPARPRAARVRARPPRHPRRQANRASRAARASTSARAPPTRRPRASASCWASPRIAGSPRRWSRCPRRRP